MKRRQLFIEPNTRAKSRRVNTAAETITTLPVEMQYHIASFLPQSDLTSLMQTSSSFQAMGQRLIRTAHGCSLPGQ